MRTVQQLIDKNVDRDRMTDEEHEAFVNYWFDKYEQYGFCKTFESPFDLSEEQAPYKGKPFKVIGRGHINEVDLEILPVWHIKFEDGYKMFAYPEEITKIERGEA